MVSLFPPKNTAVGSREMVQWFSAFIALAEE